VDETSSFYQRHHHHHHHHHHHNGRTTSPPPANTNKNISATLSQLTTTESKWLTMDEEDYGDNEI